MFESPEGISYPIHSMPPWTIDVGLSSTQDLVEYLQSCHVDLSGFLDELSSLSRNRSTSWLSYVQSELDIAHTYPSVGKTMP